MWQKILKTNFRDWPSLATFLRLPHDEVETPFPLNLPRRLAEKIEKGNLNDPLLRQFLPSREENRQADGFTSNPVGDREARAAPRLLRKYRGRALLVCTSACAMHCRYCFRRDFDYACGPLDLSKEIEQIASDTSLNEVILSGGDPLSLSNRVLGELIDQLSAIPHLKRLRFHSRFPIGIPERIDEGLISLLKKTRLQAWFVLHINHPREIDDEIIAACHKLQALGIPLLNQAVLLRGVNDEIETLTALSEALVDVGISPYYLHQLDRVMGSSHFEVPQQEGEELIEELRKRLSGYAVPTYVQEIAGEESKTPLTSDRPSAAQEDRVPV